MKIFNLKISICLAFIIKSFVGFGQEIPYSIVVPQIITDTVKWDTDDPAIWINKTDKSKSLIIGTDKDSSGSLYAFNLKGKVEKVYGGLARPNNVDIAYNFPFKGENIDIAVVSERLGKRIRILKLPELELIDSGDLIVLDGDENRAPMGVALYNRKEDNSFFVFVSGKTGPEEGYIGQYLIKSDEQGKIRIELARQFGKYSGKKEIEAIAVDEELGYVYYSDEKVGVRKYYANPDVENANKELALFATQGFVGDHEGISIYKNADGKGYIIVSDQQADQFWIFPREGTPGHPHNHIPIKIIKVAASRSDGNDITSVSLPGFPNGLWVVMSNNKTFHYYSCKYIIGD